MNYDVRWYNLQKTIILVQFKPGWIWTEFHAAVNETYDQIRMVEHEVHAIVDIRQGISLPSLDLVRHVTVITFNRPPNYGRTIVVGADPLTKALSNRFMKRYRDRNRSFMFHTSVEAAAQLLE